MLIKALQKRPWDLDVVDYFTDDYKDLLSKKDDWTKFYEIQAIKQNYKVFDFNFITDFI